MLNFNFAAGQAPASLESIMTILLARNKEMEEMQIQISTLLNKVDRVERLTGKEAKGICSTGGGTD